MRVKFWERGSNFRGVIFFWGGVIFFFFWGGGKKFGGGGSKIQGGSNLCKIFNFYEEICGSKKFFIILKFDWFY